MPRKKDGMLFELQPRPTKGDDGKPLLYAQPVILHKYNIEAVDEFCAKYRYANKGEIKRLFDVFFDVSTMLLREGNRVETPIGSFAPKLKLQGDFTDPEKVKGRDVSYSGVEFIPSKKFVKESDCSRGGFLPVRGRVGNSQKDDAEAMEKALRDSTRYGYITIKSFIIFSGLKYKSAKAYLDSLCEGDSPRLDRYREGHAWHYKVLSTPSTERKQVDSE